MKKRLCRVCGKKEATCRDREDSRGRRLICFGCNAERLRSDLVIVLAGIEASRTLDRKMTHVQVP